MSETLQTSGRKLQPPKEGEWFEVKPKTIDRKLFEEEREDPEQERTRQLILEAFAEVDSNPEKYGEDFETMMPKVNYCPSIDGDGVRIMACELGDHEADWVEQALQWAQRIANGETWKAVCNDPDTADWSRVIRWKDGRLHPVGGARLSMYHHEPASYVWMGIITLRCSESEVVPLVVRRNKVA